MLVLGRVLVRDRYRFSWIVAALVLASTAAGIVPGFMQEAPRSTVESIASSLQPLASAYIVPSSEEQDPLGVLGRVHRGLQSSEPVYPIDSWVGMVVLHVYSEYWLVGRPVATGGGYTCQVEYAAYSEGFNAYDFSSWSPFTYNGTTIHCNLNFKNVAALAPYDFSSLEAIGVRLVDGRWPSPGAEFAAARWLVEEKGWRVGDTVEVFPGYSARLVGVFETTLGLGRVLVPSMFGFIPGRVGIVVHPDSIGGLAGALVDWAKSASSNPYDAAAMATLYPVKPGNLTPPEYKAGLHGVVPGSALLLAERGEVAGAPDVVVSPPGFMGYSGAALLVAYNVDTDVIVDRVLSGRATPMDDLVFEVARSMLGHLEAAGVELGAGENSLNNLVFGEGEEAGFAGHSVTLFFNLDNLNTVLSMGNPAFSPIAVTAMLSGVLLILLVASRGVTETLRVVVDDLRAPLALLVARGASTERLSSSLRNLLLATGVAAALAGGGVAALLGYGGVRLTLTAAALVSLLAAYIAARRASRHVRSVEPVEAVRPTVRLSRVEVAGRRLDMLIAGLSALALAVGLYGDPEGLVEKAYEHGTVALALAVVATAAAFMFTPFLLPAVVKAGSDMLVGSRRIAGLAVAAAARLAGSLGWAARSGAGRIRGRIAASVLAPASILGGAVAAALSYSYTASIAEGLSLEGSGSTTLIELAGSLKAMVAIYSASALLLWGLGLVSTYVLAHSLLEVVSREIVVARARGASRSQALRLALGLILPAPLQAVITAAVLGVLGYLATVAVVRFYFGVAGDTMGWEAPLLAAAPEGLVLSWVILASGILLPVLLALARAAPSDVAGALRRLEWR